MSKQESPEEITQMSLLDHLLELRTRLLHSVLATLLVFLSIVWFANDIYSFVSKPIRNALPQGATMIATDVTSPFFAPFKLTLFVAFFLAMPYILHQIWRFISPGLYAHEKRIAVPLLIASIFLFYLGIAFAYTVIFPIILAFFTSVGPAEVQLAPDINAYLSIALKLFFAFGLAFQIPVATVLLIWSGIVSVEQLQEKRPYVVVSCFVIGMLLTPPDIFSQTLLAVPMWVLFELGIILGRLITKKTESSHSDNAPQD